MTQEEATARAAGIDWYSGLSHREWAVWHVLCEIWSLQRQLPARERLTEAQIQALVRELTGLGRLRTGTPLSLTPEQCHLLVQLRLLSALTDRRTGPDRSTDVTPPNLNWTEPSRPGQFTGPPELLDGLLTLATGVVQVLTGFHVAGGIVAMLHGAQRIAWPDSPLTEITGVVRKTLTPGITAIQESVKMMAPLPDNAHSGRRDAMCLAVYEITGVEVTAFNHQLRQVEGGTRSTPDLPPAATLPDAPPLHHPVQAPMPPVRADTEEPDETPVIGRSLIPEAFPPTEPRLKLNLDEDPDPPTTLRRPPPGLGF